MKTFVIGDIHGGLKALIQILEQVTISPNDRLVFLGDYVDGWSESVQVLDYLMDLNLKYNCVFIRGNHDALLLEWLTNENPSFNENLWKQHGGEATILAYKNIDDSHKERHITFLKNLQNYFIDENNNLYVHAGFSNLKGVAFEYHETAFYWDRTLWEVALALNPNLSTASNLYPKRLKLYNQIFIGHTPVTQINEKTPVSFANIWNIDTGAAFNGKLSIMDIDTKDFWQSDFLKNLYPNERGRN